MSDQPDTDLDLLAAEYVLGTLDAATAHAVAARVAREPGLARAVAAWEARLAPLAELAAPVPPPVALWDRLAAATAAPAPPAAAVTPLRRAWRSLPVWRAGTAAGFALAAGIAAFALLRPPPPHERALAALVPSGSAAAAFVAERMPDGKLRLVAMRAFTMPPGKDMELWAQAEGEIRPVSLGIVPADAPMRPMPMPPMPRRRMQLMVSLEPAGGSPTGQPSGPVIYQGALASAN